MVGNSARRCSLTLSPALISNMINGENAVLLALRIDLDKIRRRPTARGVFPIETGDVHHFTGAAVTKRVEFARTAKDEASVALTVGQRERRNIKIDRRVQFAVAL